MNVSDFDFELPDELIAQFPPEQRGASRLLVLHRDGKIDDAMFSQLDRYLTKGDLLVLNNTRVFPARLIGHRVPSGGTVECLLLRELPLSNLQPFPPSTFPLRTSTWEALVHPGQKLKPGARVMFARDEVRIEGEVLAMHFNGRRTVRLSTDDPRGIAAAIERIGHIPLPPYIKREDTASDRDRYQTIYARERGSVAAPTAGLHFTAGQLDELASRGVERVEVTLHVGYGTFKPVKADRVEDHVVDAERFSVSAAAAAALTRAARDGRRIIAVGTTTVRTLESLTMTPDGDVLPADGETSLFIHPGHHFQLVSGMITNFHLPRSSLLMLVSALAGRERMVIAYQHAVARRYRFYSYGDAMLIL